MLQIISGKFFKTDNRHAFQAKSILYTNSRIFSSISTISGTLDADGVHEFTKPSGVVFSYLNQIEKAVTSPRAGELVRSGDKEIVESFRSHACVGLGSYFSRDIVKVEKLCTANRRSKIPLLQDSVLITEDKIEFFQKYISKIISLPRKDFEIIDRCVQQFVHSLEVIDENIDLAYSMFVYCIEALAQEYESDASSWGDFEPSVKQRLENIFEKIEDKTITEDIKETLLCGYHNRVKRRFLAFVQKNVADDFFISGCPTSALMASDLTNAVNNLYESRCGYVHELAPIQEQIRLDMWAGDSIDFENQTYLTINGVIRLTLHVIFQVVNKQSSIETEDIDWRSCLPGIVRFKLAPEYWLAKGETFNEEESSLRLSGFLQMVEGAIFYSKSIVDIRDLMKKVVSVFDQSKNENKRSMMALVGIFISLTNEIDSAEDTKVFFQKHYSILEKCSIQSLLYSMFAPQSENWSAAECSEQLNLYYKQKHKKNGISLTARLSVALILQVANRHLRESNIIEYRRLVLMARLEATGDKVLQDKLLNISSVLEEIDVHGLLVVNVEVKA